MVGMRPQIDDFGGTPRVDPEPLLNNKEFFRSLTLRIGPSPPPPPSRPRRRGRRDGKDLTIEVLDLWLQALAAPPPHLPAPGEELGEGEGPDF